MKTIELVISETGRGNLKESPSCFNTIRESFKDRDELKKYLELRYGKIPVGKNKVYIDGIDNERVIVGFSHSFWNKDYSHNSKKWYKTDWITFWEQETTKKYFNLLAV